jgi:alpha-tubulin suppressor-like RCC1 family protein
MKNLLKRAAVAACLLPALFTGACKGAPKFKIKEVYAGVGHVFILKDDGTLWAAGYNHFGQLGLGASPDGGEANPRTVMRVPEGEGGAALTGIRDVAPGESHTLLLKDDGTLWAAGDNSYGALGLGEGGEPRTPVFTQVMTGGTTGDPIRGVRAIAAGGDASFFIKDDGTLWAAGYNYYGQLGLEGAGVCYTFTPVSSAGNDVKAVSAGSRHTVILKNDGTLWAAGHNHFGQLGLEGAADSAAFVPVAGAGTDIRALAAGNNHTAVLKNDGTLWAAGGNYSGQLGLGDFEKHSGFVKTPLEGIREIAASGDNTVALKADGTLWGAGDNVFGQLGQANEEFEFARNVFVPLKVEGAKNAPPGMRPLSAGARSIYIIGSDGVLRGAGSNRYGQLNLGDEVEDAPEMRVIYP